MSNFKKPKSLREINPVGERIAWCRRQLAMTVSDVSILTGIPRGTYCDREAGMRAIDHEEYLILAQLFNHKWKEKRLNIKGPSFKRVQIFSVSVIWILYGIDQE